MKILPDPGTEQWVPLARKKLSELSARRRALGLPVLTRHLDVGGVRIDLKSMDGLEKARITGGATGYLLDFSVSDSKGLPPRSYFVQSSNAKEYEAINNGEFFAGTSISRDARTGAQQDSLGRLLVSRRRRAPLLFTGHIFTAGGNVPSMITNRGPSEGSSSGLFGGAVEVAAGSSAVQAVSVGGDFVYATKQTGVPAAYAMDVDQILEDALPPDRWSAVTKATDTKCGRPPQMAAFYDSLSPPHTLIDMSTITSPDAVDAELTSLGMGLSFDPFLTYIALAATPYGSVGLTVLCMPVYNPFTDQLLAHTHMNYVAGFTTISATAVNINLSTRISTYEYAPSTNTWNHPIYEREFHIGYRRASTVLVDGQPGSWSISPPLIDDEALRSPLTGSIFLPRALPYAAQESLSADLRWVDSGRTATPPTLDGNGAYQGPAGGNTASSTSAGSSLRDANGVLSTGLPSLTSVHDSVSMVNSSRDGALSLHIGPLEDGFPPPAVPYGVYWSWRKAGSSEGMSTVFTGLTRNDYDDANPGAFLSPRGDELWQGGPEGPKGIEYWREGVKLRSYPSVFVAAPNVDYSKPSPDGFWSVTDLFGWSYARRAMKARLLTTLQTFTELGVTVSQWSSVVALVRYLPASGTFKILETYSEARATQTVDGAPVTFSQALLTQPEFLPALHALPEAS